MDPNIKQSIIDRLKQTNNVLVTVKTNPSVDQLAACIGLTLFLNKLGKHATAVFSGEVPSTIEFLKPEDTLEKDTNSLRDFIIALDKSKADKLRYKVEDKVVKIFITPYRTSLSQDDLEFSQGDFNVDVVMALGVHAREELDQAIVAHGRILHDATVASINCGKAADLGALNWNDDKASSLCEMVAGLIDTMQANTIDAQMATAFLTGIVAETDRFSNTKTTSTTMSISAKLMAAGANQQLVASKLQEPEKPTQSSGQNDTETDNGMLEIEHSKDTVNNELPIPEDDDSTIHIDEEGNLQTGLQDEKTKREEAPAKPSRLTLEPPTLGSKLTANTDEDKEDEPTSDPLSGEKHAGPILEHKKPLGTPDYPKVDNSKSQTETLDSTPKAINIKPTETLSAIEEQVDSPHTNMAPSSTTPPTLNDLLAQNSSNEDLSGSTPPNTPSAPPTTQPPSIDIPSSSPTPHPGLNELLGQNSSNDDTVNASQNQTEGLPPASGIDDARKAVEAAAQASMAAPIEPIQALNAQPLSENLNAQSPLPGQPSSSNVVPLPTVGNTPVPPQSPQPNDLGLDLPPSLIPPDQGLPPEQTGTSQPPTAPPPVPPPMMPPGL